MGTDSAPSFQAHIPPSEERDAIRAAVREVEGATRPEEVHGALTRIARAVTVPLVCSQGWESVIKKSPLLTPDLVHRAWLRFPGLGRALLEHPAFPPEEEAWLLSEALPRFLAGSRSLDSHGMEVASTLHALFRRRRPSAESPEVRPLLPLLRPLLRSSGEKEWERQQYRSEVTDLLLLSPDLSPQVLLELVPWAGRDQGWEAMRDLALHPQSGVAVWEALLDLENAGSVAGAIGAHPGARTHPRIRPRLREHVEGDAKLRLHLLEEARGEEFRTHLAILAREAPRHLAERLRQAGLAGLSDLAEADRLQLLTSPSAELRLAALLLLAPEKARICGEHASHSGRDR